ncbi:hypothetical protein F935_01201 [Acinetobacter calcoaceticus ANC 3811]|uniref:Uncharacterized protein n=2 Tax=Acinetobacter calcoaceticus/baumannii complex TaxID=909768 RepID=R8Y7Z3_ACICA|nr:hypothetical protein [Acinetobacter calcoaceticus]EOQ63572.1 hypothetical protein F935_01201 [Acinetobacter calcoaceticus ANC 3811]
MSLREDNIKIIAEYLDNLLNNFTIPVINSLNDNNTKDFNELKKEIDFNIRKLIKYISLNYKYISTSNQTKLSEVLKELTTSLQEIIKNPPTEGKDDIYFKQIKGYIEYILNDVISFYEYDFSHTYSINEVNELLKILDFFCDNNAVNLPNLILESGRTLEEKSISSNFNELAETIIDALNCFFRNRTFEVKSYIKKIFNIIKSIQLEYEEDKLLQKAEKVNETTEQTVRQLNLSQNIGLITLFNDEANKYEKKIQSYTYAIIFIFCIIICSIFLKLILSSQHFELNKSIIFIALITSLSAFLAYFIKERSRIYNLETYCRKNYMELSALSPYMAELTEEQRQTLRIHLSEKYFKGHENIDTNSENTNQISMFSEIIKTLNELKPKN